MKVGVIGLGDIACKAYLPIITTLGLDIVLCSRNKEIVAEHMMKYRMSESCHNYKDLLDFSVEAVFIHTATSSHYEIIKFFLQHNIHVYVDKPISYHLEETLELYEMALERKLVLMVGFNRRYSLGVQQMMDLEKPTTLFIQKNRYNLPGEIETFIYDDFIHVLDTLFYLFHDQQVELDFQSQIVNQQLNMLTVMVKGEHGVAIGSMNRQSGIKEERIEYTTTHTKYILTDLDRMEIYKDNRQTIQKPDDWTSVLKRRGFETIIATFLDYLSHPMNARESLEQSIRTHEVCEYLVMKLSQ